MLQTGFMRAWDSSLCPGNSVKLPEQPQMFPQEYICQQDKSSSTRLTRKYRSHLACWQPQTATSRIQANRTSGIRLKRLVSDV